MRGSKQSNVKQRRLRGRPKLEEVAAIESKLLAVALKEFVKHGYGATSTRKIAKAAGISKTTLYSKFPSKEQLFRAIMQEQIKRIAGTGPLKLPSRQLDLEEGLKAYANHRIDLSFRGDLLQVNRLIYSEAHRFPELGVAAAERTNLGVKEISDFIRECAARDEIPCNDAEAVAEVFILMLRGWYVNATLTNRKVGAAQRRQWVERAVHTMLSARSDW